MHVQANLPAVTASAAAASICLPEIREIRVMGVLPAPVVNPQRTTNSGLLMKCMNLLARASSGSCVQVVPRVEAAPDAAAIRIVVLILIRPRIRIVTRHLF